MRTPPLHTKAAARMRRRVLCWDVASSLADLLRVYRSRDDGHPGNDVQKAAVRELADRLGVLVEAIREQP